MVNKFRKQSYTNEANTKATVSRMLCILLLFTFLWKEEEGSGRSRGGEVRDAAAGNATVSARGENLQPRS